MGAGGTVSPGCMVAWRGPPPLSWDEERWLGRHWRSQSVTKDSFRIHNHPSDRASDVMAAVRRGTEVEAQRSAVAWRWGAVEEGNGEVGMGAAMDEERTSTGQRQGHGVTTARWGGGGDNEDEVGRRGRMSSPLWRGRVDIMVIAESLGERAGGERERKSKGEGMGWLGCSCSAWWAGMASMKGLFACWVGSGMAQLIVS